MTVVDFPRAAGRVHRSDLERDYKSLRACLLYILDDVRALGLSNAATLLESAVETADQEFAAR